jgi:RNA polymerase sigma-70 factor (ECF subfamily)
VRRIVKNREDARDLAQIAFVKAYREIRNFDERHRFFSWLYRIAVHEALNPVRRSGRTEPIVGDRASGVPGPHDDLSARERGRLVEAAVITPSASRHPLRHWTAHEQIADAWQSGT